MKLILFDCDGTIVDSQNGIVAAMDYAFNAADLTPPPRRAVLDIVGLSLPQVFAVLAPEQTEVTRSRLVAHYRDAFSTLRQSPAHQEPLFPGARAVIQALASRDDVLLGIATGKSLRGVDRLFAREGFGPYFHSIQTADHHPSKPHPAMIMTAMAEAGALPADTVMIGDTTYDMEMAASAGVPGLGVSWGYHPADWLVEAGAHRVVASYDDVIAAIDELLDEGGRGQ